MRKLFLCMSLLLAFSLMSFTSANEMDVIVDNDVSVEIADANYEVQYEIVEYTFDICTVTVTITYANGNTSSATATNNQGDCGAAQSAAYSAASARGSFNE